MQFLKRWLLYILEAKKTSFINNHPGHNMKTFLKVAVVSAVIYAAIVLLSNPVQLALANMNTAVENLNETFGQTNLALGSLLVAFSWLFVMLFCNPSKPRD